MTMTVRRIRFFGKFLLLSSREYIFSRILYLKWLNFLNEVDRFCVEPSVSST